MEEGHRNVSRVMEDKQRINESFSRWWGLVSIYQLTAGMKRSTSISGGPRRKDFSDVGCSCVPVRPRALWKSLQYRTIRLDLKHLSKLFLFMEEKRFANVMTRNHFQPGTVSYQTRHAITQIFKNTLKFWVSTKKRFFREKKEPACFCFLIQSICFFRQTRQIFKE